MSPASLSVSANQMVVFEFSVYNAVVRKLCAAGQFHPELDENWANTHYIEIRANDVESATRRIEARYPPSRGFVIGAAMQSKR